MTKTNYGIYFKALSELNTPTPDIEVIKDQEFYTEDDKAYCGIIRWKEVILLNGLFSTVKGAGSQLIDSVQIYFNKPVLINVTASNSNLIDFYLSIGFSTISIEETTILMRRGVHPETWFLDSDDTF